MLRAAVLFALLPISVSAEPPSCEDYTPVVAAYNANTRALSDMFKWCAGIGAGQPACDHLNRLGRDGNLSELNKDAAMAMTILTIECVASWKSTKSKPSE